MTTPALRVLVVDDELQARKRVIRLLEPLTDYCVVGSCANADEALRLLDSLKPDVLLLDISMPGISGLEAARTRFPRSLSIVFVTAHADHAIDAFDLGAADYILKPVTAERLAKALARVAERLAAARAAEHAAPIARIPIDTRAGTVLVDPHAIAYAHFDGALVTLFTANESWVTTLTLKDLEDRLGADFVRVDRRHVLNLREVARLEPNDAGGATAITRSGFRVPISRQARRDLAKRLDL